MVARIQAVSTRFDAPSLPGRLPYPCALPTVQQGWKAPRAGPPLSTACRERAGPGRTLWPLTKSGGGGLFLRDIMALGKGAQRRAQRGASLVTPCFA